MRRRFLPVVTLAVAAAIAVAAPPAAGQEAPPAPASAPGPVAPLRLTFREIVERAQKNNPTVQQAAAGILRAEALLRQQSALALPVVSGGVTITELNKGVSFNGMTASARTQAVGTLAVSAPLFAPVTWALKAQAADNAQIAEISAADVRRQIAVMTAQACLAIIVREQVLDANQRAVDVARAHFEYARQRREGGAGTRLNELRAQQSLSADLALVQQASAGLYQAQEALGVLMAEDGPVTVTDEPLLEVPASVDASLPAISAARTDLRLAAARERAAERIVGDSWKDWLPSVSGLFQPQVQHPSTLFQPTFTWRAQAVASIPVFDFGYRSARKAERQASLDQARIAQTALARVAESEVRTARAVLQSAEQVLETTREAARQAHDVVDIVNVSFRVGASTNIEVIDAQRAARDADTATALAENQVRVARLSLLVALGLFP